MNHGKSQVNMKWPLTVALGLAWIAACESLLFLDLFFRNGVVIPAPAAMLPPSPHDTLSTVAQWVARHVTPLCWAGYLVTADGFLAMLAKRKNRPDICSTRQRPNRFVLACLTSVSVWCYFDAVNFMFMDAWRYHGLPDNPIEKYAGYFIAFAAISPAMFLAAQGYQYLGLQHARIIRIPMGPNVMMGLFLLGGAMTAYPFIIQSPIGNLTLWVGLIFLLDPINHWLGGPSILQDWSFARWGRTLSLMAGGATCGLLWEFWNYWARSKWTYHLPFLGSLESYRYFEMPWLGFLGFLPFAVECWVLFNTFLALCERLGLRLAEPLPNHDSIL
jgi:hypothetical protein